MVRLACATLLLLAPIHVINAGSLTFLGATKHDQQVERHGGHRHGHNHSHDHAHHGHKRQHRGECWKHRPVHKRFHKSFMQQTPHTLEHPEVGMPGAGMHPDEIVPFETVTKDGFLKLDCIKDAMLEKGDKFGNGKHKYEFGTKMGVSIVHYSEIIPKEDRQSMTINRCFDFCRTVPNMVYFGLNAGRDCYCTPFFKPMEGDGTHCDEVCPGDSSQTCGGKTSSDIYEMHTCDDARSNLEDIITEVEDKIFLHLQDLADHVKDIADEATWDSNEMEKVFGMAGVPLTADLMREAKDYAGVLEKKATKVQQLIDSMQDPYDAATESLNKNLRDFDNLKVAENAIKDLKKGVKTAKEDAEEMRNLMKDFHPHSLMGDRDFNSTGAAAQYYPMMYFADPDFQTQFVLEGMQMYMQPATCTGKLLQIVFGAVADDCAHSCDNLPGRCDGFQYMAFNDGMCFLFESVKRVEVFEGCTQNSENPAPFNAQCFGKLSRLESVGSIAPRENAIMEEAQGKRQGTGKCAHCLKSLRKIEACYEYDSVCIGNEHDMELSNGQSCEHIAKHNPGWCAWDWGRPGLHGGSGQWLQASQVCPQCGYCITNGKAAGDPPIPWENEHWAGDPHNMNYDYYYYE